MAMTMIEKILAAHAGVDSARPGDIVVCEIDKIVLIDLQFAGDGNDTIPKRIADPARVVVIMDHTVPAPTIIDATGHRRAREFVHRFQIQRFFDVGNHGICHQVILEEALALPGQMLACVDSHTCASGAFNCAARGMGPAEMLQVLCTGKAWYQVAPTVKFVLHGEKPRGVFGKDVFLHMAAIAGSVEGHNIEFDGAGIASLSLDDRATIATMCAELSADFATFPADKLVVDHITSMSGTREGFFPVVSDPGAEYAAVHTIDLSQLVPYVAKPDFVPRNTLPVSELGEKVRIDQAFVGSCANGKLEDLRIASEIVKGRRVAAGVRFIVTPASQRVYLEAVRRGYVEALLAAGAVVTNSTCGACYGGHMGLVGPGDVCITSSTRNFKGRMGSPEAKIYLASSATVAASAIAGHIVDPSSTGFSL